MADVEKVIKAMTICGTGKCEDELWNKCPYSGLERCAVAVVDDAIKLLKEQQKQIQALKKNNNYLKNKVKDQRALIEAYKTGVRWEKRT